MPPRDAATSPSGFSIRLAVGAGIATCVIPGERFAMRHRGDRLSSRLIRGPGRTSKLKTMIVAIAALDSMAFEDVSYP